MIVPCTAIKNVAEKMDPEIIRGFEWLIKTCDSDYKSLSKRVKKQTEEQKELEAKVKFEKVPKC